MGREGKEGRGVRRWPSHNMTSDWGGLGSFVPIWGRISHPFGEEGWRGVRWWPSHNMTSDWGDLGSFVPIWGSFVPIWGLFSHPFGGIGGGGMGREGKGDKGGQVVASP